MPRPTRLRSSRACAGERLDRFSCLSGIGSSALDLHEVADLAEHAGEHRGLLVLGAAADAAEPECAQGTAMPLGLSDLGPNLGDAKLGHLRPILLAAKGTALWLLLGSGFGCRLRLRGSLRLDRLFGGCLLRGSLLDNSRLLLDDGRC